MKVHFLVIAALTCISSFAHSTEKSGCISLAQTLPKLKTPKLTITQLGNYNWSTNNGGVSKLIQAMNENPSICSDLEKVIQFATHPEVKSLAARTEKEGGYSLIEVLISRGENLGIIENYGTHTSRIVYENSNYKEGSELIMSDLTLFNYGANSVAHYGCSLISNHNECFQQLQVGVEQIERAEQN